MKIYRNGKEIVLTDEEIMEAHAEHIKSFMRNELITVYGLPEEEAEDYAELAYSHYTTSIYKFDRTEGNFSTIIK